MRAGFVLAGLVGVLVLAGCGNGLPDPEKVKTHEDAADAMLECVEAFVTLIEGIETVDDVQEIKPELQVIANVMGEIMLKTKTFEPIDPHGWGSLVEERSKPLEARYAAILEWLDENPEIDEALRDVIWEVEQEATNEIELPDLM